MNIPQELFNTLEQAVSTTEGKALYILTLICIAMILDFLLGSFAAWRDARSRCFQFRRSCTQRNEAFQ